MAAKPKTPTAPGISALLRKAGFERSERSATRIWGYHTRSEGYVATSRGDGEVAVWHEMGFFLNDDAIVRRRTEKEALYADAIEAVGYAVERGDGGMFSPVIVRALPAETKES